MKLDLLYLFNCAQNGVRNANTVVSMEGIDGLCFDCYSYDLSRILLLMQDDIGLYLTHRVEVSPLNLSECRVFLYPRG